MRWVHHSRPCSGNLRDRYQSYSATYKTHAMTNIHGGAGHTGEDGDLDSHVEDTGGIYI